MTGSTQQQSNPIHNIGVPLDYIIIAVVFFIIGIRLGHILTKGGTHQHHL